ncbi:hypothetical protein [Actinomadura macrotermitis]|uniref:Uncharacterized protein n=1 Tax=Actinomadura macrotermitis TaxID=2585200 RepID=A0A7K0BUX5_9ACTN|nr:hypothetical protein [Actinomadura macrotermitis]MQY05010.1 hypothetical protein [Actinomadura macrotermitis]
MLDFLVRFALTGSAGLLRLGAPLRDLVAEYGGPWDIGRVGKHDRWPHLYSYGDVEFTVCRCRMVTHISVPTWRETVELPPGLGTVPATVTYRQLTEALSAAGCAWEPLPPIPGQCGIRAMPERIEFVFVTEEEPEPLLHGAHSWFLPHDCIDTATAAARFPDDLPPE